MALWTMRVYPVEILEVALPVNLRPYAAWICEYLRERSLAYVHFDEIIPNLFLGNEDADKFDDDGSGHYHIPFTHIVSAREAPAKVVLATPHLTQHLRLNLEDKKTENIAQHFDKAALWIHDALRQPNCRVLVHCKSGHSRSPTIVAAYLIRFYELSDTHALALINRYRTVKPNSGFRKQLSDYFSLLLKIKT